MIGLVLRARRRIARSEGERGSIPMLLLVMLLGTLLGGLIMPMVISQTRTTRFDTSRVAALAAAQSGVQVVVGQIRAAVGSDGVGDAGQLPCGPLTGTSAGAGAGSYYVEVLYYSLDPIAFTDKSEPMICAPGYGPYDAQASPPTRTPHFACIVSTGSVGEAPSSNPDSETNRECADAAGRYPGTSPKGITKGRTIVTTYVFTTDDTNISGGVIRIFPDGGASQYCMDAGAHPAAGTQVLVQPCSTSTPPSAQQTWAYRSDLSIQLVGTASSTDPGLCLDSAMPHEAGNPIVLAACQDYAKQPPDAPEPSEQWSVDDNAHLRGALADGSNTDGYCINLASQAAGVPLTLQACKGSVTDVNQTWVPSPSTGAGMAGSNNGQLVNFFRFGTCIDVTGQNPDSSYLILYTCKQNPNPAKVTWNQIFTPSPSLQSDAQAKPTVVEWVTHDTANNTDYCLKSTGGDGAYVVASRCPSSRPTGSSPYLWSTNRLLQTDGRTPLSYDNRYTITSASNGLCLGIGPSNDLHDGQYQKVVTTTCNGSTGQKWNADPSTGRSVLQNTRER